MRNNSVPVKPVQFLTFSAHTLFSILCVPTAMHCTPSNHIQEQFNLISPFVMHIKPSRSSSIVCVWDHSHVLFVITKQRNTYSWEGLSYTLFFVYFILFRKLPELSSGFIVHAYPGGPYSSLFPPLTSFTSQPHAHFSCSLSLLFFYVIVVSSSLSFWERQGGCPISMSLFPLGRKEAFPLASEP